MVHIPPNHLGQGNAVAGPAKQTALINRNAVYQELETSNTTAGIGIRAAFIIVCRAEQPEISCQFIA